MTPFNKKISIAILITLCFTRAGLGAIKPVASDPAPEAIQLLNYLYSISGKYTLTGQHCAPLLGSARLAGVEKQTGFYPAVFGQDFGFSAAGTWDGINFRQQIVDEAIRRYHEGFVITLMWHALNPKHDEPVTFSGSVQTRLSDQEWRELTTPGTELNERWKSQVDVIAFFLKQLRSAGVPVLWRPYHEMNGSWFWWGNRPGKNGYQKLYHMLFERFDLFHKLNNLIWVFNANEIRDGITVYDPFYPGHSVVDVLATDVYSAKYNLDNYQLLLKLAGDKPIALGEVGILPNLKQLHLQPRWTWFMSWKDPDNYFWHDQNAIKSLYTADQTLTLDELPWVNIKQPRIHHPILK